MTKTQITARIRLFETVLKKAAKKTVQIGNDAWKPIKEATETASIRAFLVQKGAGIDYLNRNLTQLLSKAGRVVKFAGLFLHGTPMVKGWTVDAKGKRKHNRVCELADLMTVFLYLDSGKRIKRMRTVFFQAKMKPSTGSHVIDDVEQRQLYDDCDGFDYVHGQLKGQQRFLPKGASRKKSLQFAFVEPRPPEIRTIPSAKSTLPSLSYGEHLLRFLNGKTGANIKGRKGWNEVVMELLEELAAKLCTDGRIRGPHITDLLNEFNSFENHDTWCIDEEGPDGGFGLQLVIVWDGEIPGAQTQLLSPDSPPRKRVPVSLFDSPLQTQEVVVKEDIVQEEDEEVQIRVTLE